MIAVVSLLPAALDAALATAQDGELYALPTYTALLELQQELTRRGLVDHFWAREKGLRR